MQRGTRLRVGQADPEHPLDKPQPLVERRPGQVRARGGEGLVTAGLKERRQVGDQGGPVLGVIGEQRAELPLGERAQPGVLPQQVQQAAQPQVGKPVIGAAVRLGGIPGGHVGNLARLTERVPHLAQRPRRPAGPGHRPRRERVGEPRRERPQRLVVLRARRQREQPARPHVVERADERGHAGVPAGARHRLGGAEHASTKHGGLPARGLPARQPDHHGDQVPAGYLHAERPRPGSGLAALAGRRAREAGALDQRADQRPVRLPLQRLGLRREQVAERERGSGPRQQQLVDDPRVHRLGDLDERHLAAQLHQRHRPRLGGGHQRGRQRPGVPAAELDGQPRHADARQRRDVIGEPGRRLGQRDPGRQHQLAAAQQPSDVGQLERVHPADGHVEPPGPGHHVRGATADDLQVKHLTQGKRHRFVTLQHVRNLRRSLAACH